MKNVLRRIGRSVRLAAVALAVLCARDASAGWLLWTTDFSWNWDNTGTLQDNPAPGWKGAQVWLVAQKGDDRSTRQYLSDVNGKSVYTMTTDYPTVADWMGEVAQTDLSSYSDGSYSFFVEMGTATAGSYRGFYKSDTVSYDDLVTAGHVSPNLEPADVTWNAAVGAGPWQAPEPSGGLLTLVGAALLLLRRKRGIPCARGGFDFEKRRGKDDASTRCRVHDERYMKL